MTKDALAEGRPVQEVLTEGLIAGMSVVGEDFKHNVLYVPEVLIAARAMKAGMAVLKPLLSCQRFGKSEPAGVLLMGTVRGDLHDIGKNLVCMMAEGRRIRGARHRRRSKRREIPGRRRQVQTRHHRHERAADHDDDLHENGHRRFRSRGSRPYQNGHRRRAHQPNVCGRNRRRRLRRGRLERGGSFPPAGRQCQSDWLKVFKCLCG